MMKKTAGMILAMTLMCGAAMPSHADDDSNIFNQQNDLWSVNITIRADILNKMKTKDGEKIFCTVEHELPVCIDKNNEPINGVVYETYPNGQLLSEVSMADGKPDGVKKEYYESGQLKSEANFKNGRTNGVMKEYYENGQLQAETNYKDGFPDGVKKEYYESGKLKSEAKYKDDELDGAMKTYYENGNLEMEMNLEEGEIKWYDEKGNLKKEESIAVLDRCPDCF